VVASRPNFGRLPEYLADGLGLAMFMVSACAFALLLEHPGSPVHALLPDVAVRRALMGLAMGGTLVANVMAPWGRRSGAHWNPGVTLAFWRLGHVRDADVAGYVLAQFAGGAAGVAFVAGLAGPALADPHVHYVVTRPGPAGASTAFAAEALISFLMMSVVVRMTASERYKALTPWAAGALLALFIALESPLSGTSLNPARTFGSALLARDWTAFPVYLVAPPLAMALAVEVWRLECRILGARMGGCAKVLHRNDEPCHFCGQAGREKPGTSAGEAAFTKGRRST
jgi:aquaporin Z